jgi:hypothetical protein
VALSFKVASSSQAKQGGIIQRLTRSPPTTTRPLGLFLLRLYQRVIAEDVLIIPTPLNKGPALIPNDVN